MTVEDLMDKSRTIHPDTQVIVLLFELQGCPHCHHYKPLFMKYAKQYAGKFPVWVLDANDPQYAGLADRFQISGTPSVVVAVRNGNALKWEGAQNEATTKYMFDTAAARAAQS